MRKMIWAAMAGAGAAAIFAYRSTRRHGRAIAIAHQDEMVDREIDDSFPASDPPSHTATGGTRVNGHDAF